MVKFNNGDRVEHARRGRGTFVSYDTNEEESVVSFDLDSDADGDTLTVSTNLLKVIDATSKLYEIYPETIIRYVRQRLGDDADDTSVDEDILKMSKNQVFSHVTKWNGLLGHYDETIKNWIKGIYGVDLNENK
ncbi:hypothetical protein [Bacillus atrophaeus]|uniref:hypothetical protein n=1 Tax=Bacillus atrophaeus TaxID=1452 RepID=UPI000D040CA6|nr:hypothetical protein [Bacillus atrophaeus]PRR87320.1 hypothetical protein C6W23_18375 [Bacillus atrophaeus]